MIISQVILIDLDEYRSGRFYDAAQLDRHADEKLSRARPGDVIRLRVRDLTPAPVPESLCWARPDLCYMVEADTIANGLAWEAALEEAEVVNHG